VKSPDSAARSRNPQSAVRNPQSAVRNPRLVLRAWRLSPAERLLALEASAWLTLACGAVRVLPRRWFGRLLQRAPTVRGRHELNDLALSMIERVARVHPLRPLCLEQAIAGRWMLARRGQASTLVIGASLPFAAHAWLEVDGRSAAPAGYERIWSDSGLRTAGSGSRGTDSGR
jgi:hypothetical protein